jgi:segregation and condensation protein A
MGTAGTLTEEKAPRPEVALPAFEGPLDLLLHLVRENRVSIWDIPIARICDQFQAALERMAELDLEIAGEYLVYAAWLLAIKSRLLLPRSGSDEEDPRQELVERLVEYEKVKAAAAVLAGLDEVRRGVMNLHLAVAEHVPPELPLEEIDLLTLAEAMRGVMERYRREHPAALELEPLRHTVEEKMRLLYELILQQQAFPLLSHLLTRPDRLEAVTWLLAGLELVRLGVAQAHQRCHFAEIFVTATGRPLPEEVTSSA